MDSKERIEEMNLLLESNNFIKLREVLIEQNEIDISEFIEDLPKEKAVIVFRTIPKDLAAEVF